MKCNRKVVICNENLDINSLLQFVRVRYSYAIIYKKRKISGFLCSILNQDNVEEYVYFKFNLNFIFCLICLMYEGF